MGLIDLCPQPAQGVYENWLRRMQIENKALYDWRHYCHLARIVACNYARLENIAVLDAITRLRKTE